MRQETSDEAYDSVKDRIPEIANLVLKLLIGAGPRGMTDEQIHRDLCILIPGIVYSTERSARLYLVDKLKVVIDSGRRRESKQHRQMIVWVYNKPRNVLVAPAADETVKQREKEEPVVPKATVDWLTTNSRLQEIYLGTQGPSGSPDPFECWMLSKLAEDATGCIVNIGSWRGRSECFLGSGAPKGVPVISVDHFLGDNTGGSHPDQSVAQAARDRFGVAGSIIVEDMLKVDWGKVLPCPASLVFYDSNHEYEPTMRCLTAIHPYLIPNARLAIHDALWPDSVRAINDLHKRSKLYRHVTTIDVWEGFAIMQRL